MEAINLDGEKASDGLLSLVVAVVELLIEALEEEAIRRMKSGSLTDTEVERLGRQLAAIHEEVDRLKAEAGVEEDVDRLRTDLSELVKDALERVDDEPHPGFSFLDDVRTPDPERPKQSEHSKHPPESESFNPAMHRPPVRTEVDE